MIMKLRLLFLMSVMTLIPTLAAAQANSFEDDGPLGLGFTGSGLTFKIDPTFGGAVITGVGEYDLTGNGGVLALPSRVMDTKQLTITAGVGILGDIYAGVGISIGIPDFLSWLNDGIPVVGVADSAFYNNAQVTGVSTPSSVRYIGSCAFRNCTALTGLDLTNATSLETIDQYAFTQCEGLTSLDLTNATSLVSIEDYAFQGCGFKGDLNLGNCTKLKDIGQQAFTGAYTTVSYAFDGTLTLPDNLESIGRLCFQDCDFTNNGLTLPSKLSFIGNSAFDGLLNMGGDLDMSACTLLDSIPDAAFQNYGQSNPNCGKLIFPPNVITIRGFAFNASGFTGVSKFPANLEVIRTTAFFNMPNWAGTLDLSDCSKLKVIEDAAFRFGYDYSKVSKLDSLIFPNPCNIKTIGSYAFAFNGFTNKNLVIPVSVKNLGVSTAGGTVIGGVFGGCVNLTGDLVVEGANSAQSTVFANCTGLRSITWKSPTLTFPGHATQYMPFYGCDNLEYIDLSASTLSGTYPDVDPTLLRGGSLLDTFCGVCDHTLIYLPKGTPSAIIDPNIPNFINSDDMTCGWFSVDDSPNSFIPHTFTAAKATYDRESVTSTGMTYNGLYLTNAEGVDYWKRQFINTRLGADSATLAKYSYCNTMYLPYDFSLPVGMKGYKLVEYLPEDLAKKEGPMLKFSSVDDNKFKANTPYIVRIEDKDGTIGATPLAISEVQDIVINKSPVGMGHIDEDGVTPVPSPIENPNVQVTSDNGWAFYGTTENIANVTAAGWKAYNLSNNMWCSVETGTPSGYLGSMRGFIVSKGVATPSKVSIFGLDGLGITTGIDEIFGGDEQGNPVDTKVYNLNGQYVGSDINALPKGMYIVNGNKVIK